jgi:integrase
MADRVGAALDQHHRRSHWRGDDDLVFAHPRTGDVYDPSKLRKRFKSALRRAGVREVRFHDLRHTYGTRLASVGTPLRAIQEWMGHSDSRTTQRYADYSPDPSRGAEWAARAFAHPEPPEIASPSGRSAPRLVEHAPPMPEAPRG